jgi:hypothetical protein
VREVPATQAVTLDEQQYRELCVVCDQILGESSAHVAIPWLHVLREHPAVLSQYAPLYSPGAAFWRRSWRALKSVGMWNARLARTLGRRRLSTIEGPIDILFVSHLVSAAQLRRSTDAYYGDVPSRLAEAGYSAVIALIDHVSLSDGEFSNVDTIPRVILPRVQSAPSELRSLNRARALGRDLRREASGFAPGLRRQVQLQASAEAHAGGTAAALCIATQVGELVHRAAPRVIVTTYEGHAWERLAWSEARRAKADVRCIAYQHAAVSRLQHALRRNLGPPYDPDQVLTAGVVSKRQLERAPGLRGLSIEVLGSDRGFNEEESGSVGRTRRAICLVLPEGLPTECDLLLGFALQCATMRPDTRFIWRLHPSTRFEDLARRTPQFRRLPPNVVLSQSSLAKDAGESRWALYRGTTAIVQAVGSGAIPVYLRVPGEMTIDPLYELDATREIVEKPADLMRVFANDSGAISEVARRYCAEMFVPFDPAVLARIVGAPQRR